MLNFLHKILYAVISWGLVLGLFPINCKDKEQKKPTTETPEISAAPENQHQDKEDEMPEPEDVEEREEECENEEEITQYKQAQPKRRREREGDGPDGLE